MCQNIHLIEKIYAQCTAVNELKRDRLGVMCLLSCLSLQNVRLHIIIVELFQLGRYCNSLCLRFVGSLDVLTSN